MSDDVPDTPLGEDEVEEEPEDDVEEEDAGDEDAEITTTAVTKDDEEAGAEEGENEAEADGDPEVSGEDEEGNYLFMGGKLTFEDAYKKDKDEILDFLKEFAEDPTEFGVTLSDFTVKGQKTVLSDIKEAVSNIHDLDGVKGRHNPDVKFVQVDFDNATLFLDTLADCLAWILSISAHPGPNVKSVTEKNFFLPLLGLYGTWVQQFYLDDLPEGKLSNKEFPGMLHLSWWVDKKTGRLRTLLGSTPGLGIPDPAPEGKTVNPRSSPRGNLIIRDRQKLLEDVGFPRQPLKQQKSKKPRKGAPKVVHPRVQDNFDGEEGDTGVGRCAETFFYIWAGTYVKDNGKKNLPKVYGLAIVPKAFNSTKKGSSFVSKKPPSVYKEAEIKAALAEPCPPFCQAIMMNHMENEWGWTPAFRNVIKAPRTDPLEIKIEEGGDEEDEDRDEEEEEEKPVGKKSKGGPAEGKERTAKAKSQADRDTLNDEEEKEPELASGEEYEEDAVEGDEEDEAAASVADDDGEVEIDEKTTEEAT